MSALDNCGLYEGGSRPLSPREKEVLRYIVSGFAEKQIAEELAISRQTVGRHRENIRNKTGTVGRRGLVLLARKLGVEPV